MSTTQQMSFGGMANFPLIVSISANKLKYNIAAEATAAGWNGVSPITAKITVDAGVYVWSDTTSVAAIATGSIPARSSVSIINNGYIIGCGGLGASGAVSPVAGNPGGSAISLSADIASIVNNSYIAGGGGGGGAGSVASGSGCGGGGAGGGNGGTSASGGGVGGAGGTPGSSGGLGTGGANTPGSAGGAGGGGSAPGTGGNGGGRIFPGTGGTGSSGGAGNVGGTGGSAGSPGSNGNNTYSGGGGGGWGAAGGSGASAGGAGGKAIALNGFTATVTGSGTVYGAVS